MELNFSDAAPLMCVSMTTFNALRHSGANPGDKVAIVGLAGLGHLAVQCASKMGFRTVVVAREKDREQLAKALGADTYIQTSTCDYSNVDLRSREGAEGVGGALVILATAPSSELQVSLVQALRPNGRMIILAGDPKPLQLPAASLITWCRLIRLSRRKRAYRNMGSARFRAVLTM